MEKSFLNCDDTAEKIDILTINTNVSEAFVLTNEPEILNLSKKSDYRINDLINQRIASVEVQQTDFNQNIIPILLNLNGAINALASIQNHLLEISTDSQEKINSLTQQLTLLEEANVLFENRVAALENKVDTLENKAGVLENKINILENETHKMKSTLNVINHRLWRAENQKKIPTIEEQIVIEQEELSNENNDWDIDYFLFEEQFRGSEEDIEKAVSIYLPYFQNKKNVLDIGCGRGEFLQLLLNNGVSAKGIDINDEMILYTQKLGLPVEKRDVIDYLNSVSNNTLGGIISLQVIEHLQISQLIQFIRLAYQKLEPGACFIAETPNPQSLIVFTESYFLDPSHIKLLHPLTMKFILESEGFRNVEILKSSPVSDLDKLPTVKAFEDDEQAHMNHASEFLNGLLYGDRNYAVIGYR